ncbi:MAG: hypothetical protein ACO4BJ_09540 [Planctomycetota bacterium]|jgi:uncharacterized protein YqhQ
MTGDADRKDKKEARVIAITLIVLVAIIAAGVFLLVPSIADFSATYLEPGLGLRNSAIASFFVTLIVMVIFAVASGDGLIGELQFLLPGFLGFFLIFWLMIAWVF